VAMFKPPRWRADMQLITVNLDSEEIDHNKETAVGIVADAKVALRQLTGAARGSLKPSAYEPWVRQLQAKHAANEERVQTQMQSNATPIHPLRTMKEIRSVLQRDAVLVVDGHATLNFGRQSLPTYVAGHRINSGTHGTMGVGVPFALGAKAAKPDKQVVLVTGDGAFGWQGMNIDAACRQDLPFVTVINNNAGMGASAAGRVRTSGHGGYLGWSDYQMIAQAFGGYGERVEKPEDLRPALLRAIASGKAAVINVITDQHAQASTYSGFAGDVGDFH